MYTRKLEMFHDGNFYHLGFCFKKIVPHNNLWHNMKHEAKLKRKFNPNRGRDISDGMAIW